MSEEKMDLGHEDCEVCEEARGKFVYIVSQGQYSDWQIEAIYTNREAAEAHLAAWKAHAEKRFGKDAPWMIDQYNPVQERPLEDTFVSLGRDKTF